VKQSNRRHGEKRRSHDLGCSLIQLVCGLIVIYPFPAYDAERSNVSLIILHYLLTPRTPQQGRANNGSLYTVLKTVNTPLTPREGRSLRPPFSRNHFPSSTDNGRDRRFGARSGLRWDGGTTGPTALLGTFLPGAIGATSQIQD